MYDVIVVGGGISGSMAAIASSRAGAKTLLIERYGFLGGMLTAAGVGPMMTFHVGQKQVIQGIPGELIDRLQAKGKSPGHVVDTIGYTYTVTPFDAEGLKYELESMLLESGGELLYHTHLVDVKVEEGRIQEILVLNRGGLQNLRAKVFIDATGNADLSTLAGVPCVKGRPEDGAMQPMTMNMKMTHVDIEAIRRYIKECPEEFPYLEGNTDIIDESSVLSVSGFAKTLEKGLETGELTFKIEGILFFETNNPGEVIVNTTRMHGYDPTDPWSFSKAEMEGRRQAMELEKFFRKRVKGFENAVLVYTGPEVGVRSSRQIQGEYVLTIEDITKSKKFADVIAHGGYPVDIHSPDGEEEVITETMHLPKNAMYSVPYHSLVNSHVTNIITVGRCISATFEAQGAIRVTPMAGAIGHAGGVAAALAAKQEGNVLRISIPTLQQILKEQGAYLEAE